MGKSSKRTVCKINGSNKEEDKIDGEGRATKIGGEGRATEIEEGKQLEGRMLETTTRPLPWEVELEYELKEEAAGIRDLPNSDEGWHRREKNRQMKIMSAQLSSVPPPGPPDSDCRNEHPRNLNITRPLQFGQAQLFPTTRRLAARHIGTDQSASDMEVDGWFTQPDINVYARLSKLEFRRVKRMLYTWRDVFEDDMLKIRKTDLIEYCMHSKPNSHCIPTKSAIFATRSFHKWRKQD